MLDFRNDKIGGSGCIFQVLYTMLKYKVKSHRDRAADNRTDSICTIEVCARFERAETKVIVDKRKIIILLRI